MNGFCVERYSSIGHLLVSPINEALDHHLINCKIVENGPDLELILLESVSVFG
ncbi:MAG: hypothetical protein BWY82_01475 [Verrucomicrobia bacterium ADurb.Bin474]|nr:MAG: hypothetical protein BWY82_01475 [Verrucomicrobia bacterium ADurb.Bin474]